MIKISNDNTNEGKQDYKTIPGSNKEKEMGNISYFWNNTRIIGPNCGILISTYFLIIIPTLVFFIFVYVN